MQKTENCSIRPIVFDDLERILKWRNHPDISRYMLTQHKISLKEHQDWFKHASNDPTRKLLIVEEHGVAFGFVHFSGVAPGAISNWGFYASPGAPIGSGFKLGVAAIAFAFHELELHKVCGQALAFNEASIRLHRKLGFQQEGILRDQHRIGDTYHNLICFGLLRQEWLSANQNELQ